MLNQVPTAINALTRNVVINHPNTWSCAVYHKVITRPAPESVGGIPTMGGLAVLDSADEEQFDYELAGVGYALPVTSFEPAPMVDRHDANIGAGDEFRFLVEPEEPRGHPEWFEVKKHDIIYILLTEDENPPRLAFEVIDVEAVNNISPYSVRYVCNRRDDLHINAAGEFAFSREELGLPSMEELGLDEDGNPLPDDEPAP
jgi:hypothetical protein